MKSVFVAARNLLRSLLLAAVIFLSISSLRAHEGMWIPSTLQQLVIGDMQAAGLRLTAEQIYSINQSSLKDAIVHFGGGCTAEVLSDQGLILTNHHCGYSQIQSHSSVEQDYLKDGFWAMSKGAELPNPGLSATFVKRIEDVSESMLEAAGDLEGEQREIALGRRAATLIQEATQDNHYKAEIKPFFFGNAFYLIITEVFPDVRLVGAPPSSIGKFGGDTDNWEWPRHTGDFALFRIYAGKDNLPAAYSEENIPYTPEHSLPINMSGLKPGDFTMVFGFPGRTDQYLVSDAVAYVLEEANPMRKAMREASLGVIDRAMGQSDTLRIKYAAKQSRIANAHKKWIGQSQGLEQYNALEKKKAFEREFRELAAKSDVHEADLPDQLAKLYQDYADHSLSRDFLIEFYYYGPEVLRYASSFQKFVEGYDKLSEEGELKTEKEKLKQSVESHFKNYDIRVDRDILAAQAPIVVERCPEILRPEILTEMLQKHKGDAEAMARSFFARSVFADKDALINLFKKADKKIIKSIESDPAYLTALQILSKWQEKGAPEYRRFSEAEEQLMGRYVKAMMELFPDRIYWPDANSTLRITYGAMEGSEPRDGVEYLPYTTLDGVIRKYQPGHRDFDLPKRLIDLHREGDYGPYHTDGELRVCFLGSNHTTGGNSGSPALDADGYLVGLNFDRTWESTMSDIMFNPEICRNIMVDIKYVLFIVDKFANAGHLIAEMDLRYPEAGSELHEVREKVGSSEVLIPTSVKP